LAIELTPHSFHSTLIRLVRNAIEAYIPRERVTQELLSAAVYSAIREGRSLQLLEIELQNSYQIQSDALKAAEKVVELRASVN
jgi:hypothetical protein